MIKAILTDLGNVVICASHDVTFAYLVSMGVPYEKAKQFYSIPEYTDFGRGKITPEEYAAAALDLLGRPTGWSETIIRTAHDKHIYAVDQEVLRILKTAYEDVVQFAVLTDTNPWQTDKVNQLLIGSWLAQKQCICSNETGRLKSDPDAFQFCAQKLNWEPKEILFIDDREDLCALAQDAGMLVVQFVNAKSLSNDLKLIL